MAVLGEVTQVHQTNRYGPLPGQLWKQLITVPAAHTSVSVECPKVSGTIVAVWIDPVVLAASATIKGYLSDDGLATLTPALFLNYTAPSPAVETRSALATRMRACGRLTIDVASAVAANSFYIYVWVDPNADTSGGGAAATIADGADVTQGAKADAAVTAVQDTTPTTVVGNLKGIFNKLYALVGTGFKFDQTDIHFASIIQAAGTGAVVAADATHKIRVLSYTIIGAGAGTFQWKSATTAKSGPMDYVAASGASPQCSTGLFETAVNEALNLTVTGATGNGHLSYILV
jgi:hypothetical protein